MKKKPLIILIILGIVYLIFLFVWNKTMISDSFDEKNASYIILDDNTILRVINNNVKEVEEKNINKVLSKYKFDTYINNEYKGIYSIKKFNDVWRYYDKNMEQIRLTGNLLGFSENIENEVLDLNLEKLSQNELDTIPNNKLMLKDLTINEKIVFDFDRDGQKEEFWNISSLYNSELSMNATEYAYIIYKNKDELKILDYQEVKKSEEYGKGYGYRLMHAFRMNKEKKYDIIMKRFIPFGNTGDCYLLYRLIDNNYSIIKGCQEVES